MEVFLDRVCEQEKMVLFRLLQYSLYEESGNDLNEMNDEALYSYKWFDNYFEDNDRVAFIVKEKETSKILGFVMINEVVNYFNEGHSIAEFMIIPKYRQIGLGRKVANMCFNLFHGNWEVSPSCGSKSAFIFWKKVISEYKNSKLIDNTFVFTN